MAESKLHKELKRGAIGWVAGQGCVVFAEEISFGGYQWDALGIKRNGTSYGIEAKATRADLQKGRQDNYSRNQWKHPPFTFIYLALPEGVKIGQYEWDGWGVLRMIHGELKVERRARRHDQELTIPKIVDLAFTLSSSLCYRQYGIDNGYRNEDGTSKPMIEL